MKTTVNVQLSVFTKSQNASQLLCVMGLLLAAQFMAQSATNTLYDLAVASVKAPKTINLKGPAASLTRIVKVQIRNLGSQEANIPDLETLAQLVTVQVNALGTSTCETPVANLIMGPPNKPKVLKVGKKLNVFFNVIYDCAVDSAQGAGHEDFTYTSTVHSDVLYGTADSHPANDICPRSSCVAPVSDVVLASGGGTALDFMKADISGDFNLNFSTPSNAFPTATITLGTQSMFDVVIHGQEASGNVAISVGADGVTGPGTYAITYVSYVSRELPAAAYFAYGMGTVTFTKVDLAQQKLVGKFSFNASRWFPDSFGSVNVSNGSFSISKFATSQQ
ncbi:MAG: hypothetical protein HY298_14495 [Verrucomicrobia bacterium]|nr:hypothetical protein [Verrucomicrobiota bacterium]